MAVFPVSNYRTKPFVLTGAKDSVLTCVSPFWYDVTRIRVSIGTGSAGTAKLIYFNLADNVEYILNDAGNVAVGYPLDEECDPLHMEVGDIIKITASVANMHAFVSYVLGSNAPAQAQGRPAMPSGLALGRGG